MDGFPLIVARVHHGFRMWSDVDGPRSLHLVGHYALVLEAGCESIRVGEAPASNLVDEAADLGAAAWCALQQHSASPLSEEAIAEKYSRESTATGGGWRTHAKPLAEWRRQVRQHAAAVLSSGALGPLEFENALLPGLVSVVGLTEDGAQWINRTGLGGDQLG